MFGLRSRRGRHCRATDIARGSVADMADAVTDLQARVMGWLVVWSPWRQTFTAFAGFTSEPLIIDERDPALLLTHLQMAEQTYGPMSAANAT